MLPFRRRSLSSQRRRRSSSSTRRESTEWHDHPNALTMAPTFPIHPLPSMQAPFEESMLDATGDNGHVPYTNTNKGVKTRQQLLCRDESALELSWNFTYNCHWRHNPKGKFHPLLKIVTQIVFGVHLLHQHLEKSVADVADILLKHVNELDALLQRANEDIEASLKDMLFRHKCLRVPMEHVNEFDRLLEDRSYRVQLLDGNVVIERTMGRMSTLLNDYLIDIKVLQDANRELDLYLLDIGDTWTFYNEDVARIYSAMCGNTSGWSQFLQSLVAKAERLGVTLVQVGSYCNEIEKRCGAASRRSLIATRTSSRNSSNSRDNGRAFRNPANNKPLPTPPNERPPYVSSPISGSQTPSELESRQGRPLVQQPRLQPAAEIVNKIHSPLETPKQSEDDDSASATSVTAQEVVRQPVQPQPEPEYYHEAWHGEEMRQNGVPQGETLTSRRYGHRRNMSSQSARSTEGNMPIPKRFANETSPDSPPLTGKDSAYASVSGASVVSPPIVSPRSPSATSSPRTAQFGLFPSSNLSTPKGSISGRWGPGSPTYAPTNNTTTPLETPSSTRPSTGMDYSSGSGPSSPKRLNKRSSFSSLKRLFTSKKKERPIDTIVE